LFAGDSPHSVGKLSHGEHVIKVTPVNSHKMCSRSVSRSIKINI